MLFNSAVLQTMETSIFRLPINAKGSLKMFLRLIPSDDALCRFHAFFYFVHQGNAHIALAGVAVFRVASEKSAGSYLHTRCAVKLLREAQIITIGNRQPNVE